MGTGAGIANDGCEAVEGCPSAIERGSSMGLPADTRLRETGPSPGAGDGAIAYAAEYAPRCAVMVDAFTPFTRDLRQSFQSNNLSKHERSSYGNAFAAAVTDCVVRRRSDSKAYHLSRHS